jgi:hypothetical protein
MTMRASADCTFSTASERNKVSVLSFEISYKITFWLLKL